MLLHRIGAGSCHHRPFSRPDPNHHTSRFARRRVVAAFHGVFLERKNDNHRSVCTADELHYVTVSDSDWKLALWRYLPHPKVLRRFIYRNCIFLKIFLGFLVFIENIVVELIVSVIDFENWRVIS